MTLLSILASKGIAVPLSSSFPATELQYILENSQALMLLSSTKFQRKAEDVVNQGVDVKLEVVEKNLGSSKSTDEVHLEDSLDDKGGLMLYTSGTTSRPVWDSGCI